MSSIYRTTDRLIAEHLDALLIRAWEVDEWPAVADVLANSHQPTMPFVRLVGAARSLAQQHGVDAKGRCRVCTRRRRFRRTRIQPCTVYAALSFYLTQPDELVLRELRRPSETEQTIALPRVHDRR